MYSKQEASLLRQAFWTALGLYMTPLLSSDGEKINWINYKTGKKNIQFKLEADQHSATVGIEISHSDPGMQQLYFEQFQQLKSLLYEYILEEWTWTLHQTDQHGKLTSRIYKELKGVNLYKKEDWPAIISFFKPRLLALDEFWNMVKDGFQV